jgi:hypothetical protein
LARIFPHFDFSIAEFEKFFVSVFFLGNAEGPADGTYKRTRRKTGFVVVERYPDPLLLLLGGGPM